MNARDWFHPDAGTWVAFRDEPKRRRDPASRGYVTDSGAGGCDFTDPGNGCS